MTARENRSRGRGNGSARRRKGDSSGNHDIGWGLSPEDELEGIVLRRAFFGVCVAVVLCMGVWFLVTTVTGPRILTVDGSAPGERAFFTVRLRELASSEQDAAKRLASTESMTALAGRNGFWFEDLPDGRYALCVGRFEREDAPQLQRLLRSFQSLDLGGRKAFPAAAIRRCTE